LLTFAAGVAASALSSYFTDDRGVQLAAFLVGVAFLAGVFWLIERRAQQRHSSMPPPVPVAPSPGKPRVSMSVEDAGELAAECAKTSKAIYSFLNKQADRTDEARVVAEYRQKFDAKVLKLCLDQIAGGLSTGEGLKNAMKPAASVDDIQWIARVLSITADSFDKKNLEKYREQARIELEVEDADPGD
jgi:hypothetical protein